MDKEIEGPGVAQNTREMESRKERDTVKRHGFYMSLENVDGRTCLGKAIKRLRERLREYVEEATPATEILIERILYKSIRISLYEANRLNNPAKESDHYLPMSNSLRLDLQVLSQLAGRVKSPSLDEILREIGGEPKKVKGY